MQELIRTTCAVIAALAGIAIPVVLYYATQEIKKNESRLALRADTLKIMHDLDERIATVLDRKTLLDDKNEKRGTGAYEANYIRSHPDVESQVFRLLNLYEGICLGVRHGLFDGEIVESMRGDALRLTWRDYKPYIEAHRAVSPDNARAWSACEAWAAARPGSR